MKRALVLCGGGSLGSYEAGVWQFLNEDNQTFDIVTGTSIGALNGAMYVSGQYDECVKLWDNISNDTVMRDGVNLYAGFMKDFNRQKGDRLWQFGLTYLKNKGADITPLKNLVKSVIDPKKVQSSRMDLGIVTTSYPSLKEVDVEMKKVDENNVLDYLHASSACWPVFPIYEISGKRYVDGGFNNNLPIDFALRMGAEEIVAVLLYAIPRVPQHPELMNLPFVTTIIPSHDTGFILDFYGKTCVDNAKLGYLDAKKRFGKCYGREYAFKKEDFIPAWADEFGFRLLEKNIYATSAILKALSYEGVQPKTNLEIFLRSLETLGHFLSLDYLVEYSLEDFIIAAKKAMLEDSKKKDAIASFKKSPFHRIAKKDQPAFMGVLANSIKKGTSIPDYSKLIVNSPEAAALYELLLLLKEKGLITAK